MEIKANYSNLRTIKNKNDVMYNKCRYELVDKPKKSTIQKVYT